MEENQVVSNEEIGSIKIADDVIATIAGVAASEIKGVVSMNQSIASGIAELLGKKNLGKGVRVENKEDATNIDLYISVEYGTRIPEIAWQIQENVKKSLESLAGIKVGKVNIHVEGVALMKTQLTPEDEQEVDA
ncbi:MAG: Asp23/Gls24 family envelope stress response protein [Hyphomonadaceae bacterium]|nr:Asp23/Gls24 family envelope stress response protein [Clostridia bacterium]